MWFVLRAPKRVTTNDLSESIPHVVIWRRNLNHSRRRLHMSSSSRGLARLVRRLASTNVPSPKLAANHLGAIKCDNQGNAWKVEVQVGRGSGLLGHLHPRGAPLLERTGSFGDTPATLTSRPGMLIARFQPFSAVIGDSCALLMDSDRASSKVGAQFNSSPNRVPSIYSPPSRLTPQAAAGAIAGTMSNKHSENGNHSDGTVTDAVAAAAEGFDPKMHAKIATKADSHHHQPLWSSSDAGIPVDDFPLRCLECVLDEATGYYHQKMRRLKLLTDYCLETITDELKTTRSGVAGEAGYVSFYLRMGN